MKHYRLLDPYTGNLTTQTELEMRQSYYADRALKQRLLSEQNAYFNAGDPDYRHTNTRTRDIARNFTFEDYLAQLKDDGLLI